MFDALVKYEFLRNAVWAGLFASLLCGVIGVIIVEKKLVHDERRHRPYGLRRSGAGVSYGLRADTGPSRSRSRRAGRGMAPPPGRQSARRHDLSGRWSMALGILFIALTPGYPPDLTSYLFGGIFR